MSEDSSHELTISESVRPLLKESTSTRSRGVEETLRRVMDLTLASVALALLTPVLVVVAVLVKLDSSGPVFFRQVRIGRNRRRHDDSASSAGSEGERRAVELYGEPFKLYKFRTMVADARERFPHLYRYEYSEDELRSLPIKVLVADKQSQAGLSRGERDESMLNSDPRITRLGRWLRKTSVDELPNLINVIKGDMHLVGPRPDIAANIRYYTRREKRILDVKPGVTGLAQIKGRGFLTFEETNACDLEYLERRSLLLDLKILFQTMPTLIKRHGAF